MFTPLWGRHIPGISCVDPLTEGVVILIILNEVCLRKIYPITTV